jgi:hypothetical protein
MSGPVQISSPAQLTSLLSSSRVVVVNCKLCLVARLIYTDDPCSAVYKESSTTSAALSTVYEQLAGQLSRPNTITFTKVDVDQQAQIAQSYSVTR